MNAAVVIVSNQIVDLRPCVTSVRMHEPGLCPENIIVVDRDSTEYVADFCTLQRFTRVEAPDPDNFIKCVNDGLAVALFSLECALLLSEDVLVRTPNGLTKMTERCAARPELGLLTAGSEDALSPFGVDCVAIPQRTWLSVGQLDEQLPTGRAGEDYKERVQRIGLQLLAWEEYVIEPMSGRRRNRFRSRSFVVGQEQSTPALKPSSGR